MPPRAGLPADTEGIKSAPSSVLGLLLKRFFIAPLQSCSEAQEPLLHGTHHI